MKPRPYIGSVVLIVLIAGAVGYRSLPEIGAGSVGPESGQSGSARVERVIDGDTVILSGGLGSSRLVGVDTPETVKPDTPVQCFGRRASAFTKHVLATAGTVRYRVAREPVDRYGRSLVYLWLPDGRFFNALREGDDNVPAALSLFRQIWKGFPGQVETYADLAIAVAVVWDNPRAVYNYAPHQVRTKSKMPEGEVDALGNFRYVVENEKIMEGRTKNLPWEFLTFVIDHKTPLKERAWAQAYYIANKGKGKWHQDVPYDYDMLDGEVKKSGKTPKLMGQDYTLANIRALGGVLREALALAATAA